MPLIEIGDDPRLMDAAIEALPNTPAVFAIWPREGEPYLSKTGLLRRRLLRLLREREKPSRLLNLRHAASRIEYWLSGSSLESAMIFYDQARRIFPSTYLELMKLRMPPYVKIDFTNPFPRSQVTTRLARGEAMYFGPFRSRATAERFEAAVLDLFQIRRCQEDLAPSPDHPGCIYGEMGMCLRPCQQVVGPAEYGHEVERVVEFLRSGGRSLLDSIARSRERLSEEMLFEEAARQHKRFEKARDALQLRDELAREVDNLNGAAVTRSMEPESVEIWFVRDGHWQGQRRFGYAVREGRPVSLDQSLREACDAIEAREHSARERQERLALLARWFYSSWRDGEWIEFPSYAQIPYRRLTAALSRVAKS